MSEDKSQLWDDVVFEETLREAHRLTQDALEMTRQQYNQDRPRVKRSFWVKRRLMKAQSLLIKSHIAELTHQHKQES